jgi:hypothetical protein
MNSSVQHLKSLETKVFIRPGQFGIEALMSVEVSGRTTLFHGSKTLFIVFA